MRDWTETEVFPTVHERLLDHLRALDGLDLDTAAVHGSHVRALKGAKQWDRPRLIVRVLVRSTT